MADSEPKLADAEEDLEFAEDVKDTADLFEPLDAAAKAELKAKARGSRKDLGMKGDDEYTRIATLHERDAARILRTELGAKVTPEEAAALKTGLWAGIKRHPRAIAGGVALLALSSLGVRTWVKSGDEAYQKSTAAEIAQTDARQKLLAPVTQNPNIPATLRSDEKDFAGIKTLAYIATGSHNLDEKTIKSIGELTGPTHTPTPEEQLRAVEAYKLYSKTEKARAKGFGPQVDINATDNSASAYILEKFLVPKLDPNQPDRNVEVLSTIAELKGIIDAQDIDEIPKAVMRRSIRGKLQTRQVYDPDKNSNRFVHQPSTALLALMINYWGELFLHRDSHILTKAPAKLSHQDILVNAEDLLLEGLATPENYAEPNFLLTLEDAFGKTGRVINPALDAGLLLAMNKLPKTTLQQPEVKAVYDAIKARSKPQVKTQ